MTNIDENLNIIIEEENDLYFPVETAEVLDSERELPLRIVNESYFENRHSNNHSRNVSSVNVE